MKKIIKKAQTGAEIARTNRAALQAKVKADRAEIVRKKDSVVQRNANAKGRWLDDYVKGGKKQNFAPEAFEKFYKKHTGL